MARSRSVWPAGTAAPAPTEIGQVTAARAGGRYPLSRSENADQPT